MSSKDIKRKYIKLYSNLRNYLWDYYAVSVIVDLENSCLKAFPDMTSVRRNCQELYGLAKDAMQYDDDLKASFDEFRKCVEGNDCEYHLIAVNVKQ